MSWWWWWWWFENEISEQNNPAIANTGLAAGREIKHLHLIFIRAYRDSNIPHKKQATCGQRLVASSAEIYLDIGQTSMQPYNGGSLCFSDRDCSTKDRLDKRSL